MPKDRWKFDGAVLLEYLDRAGTPNGKAQANGHAGAGLWIDLATLPPPPPREWLWKPYLPLGCITLIEGMEGIGKGLFEAWAAVQTVTGWHGAIESARVAWLSSEDDENEVTRRLLAAGWTPDLGGVELLEQKHNIRLPRDLERIEASVRAMRARLVVVDVGRDYLGPTEDRREVTNNDESWIRPALREVQAWNQRENLGFLFAHHWNKGQGDARARSTGSGAFRQVARQVLTMASWREELAISVEKANGVKKTGTLRSYAIDEVPELETARFRLGEPIQGYDDISAWMNRKKDKQEMEWCDEEVDPDLLLVQGLIERDGPLTTRQIAEAIYGDGESGSVHKARGRLKRWREAGHIEQVDQGGGRNNASTWGLPADW